jgi:hypothetical protein
MAKPGEGGLSFDLLDDPVIAAYFYPVFIGSDASQLRRWSGFVSPVV